MEGVIRPVDDPLWRTWFTPNGWGCKCWLQQISAAEADRRGGVTPAFDVPTRSFSRTRDDGTVERVQVPVGIDPGWQTNPGLARAETLMRNLTDRLARAGEPAARSLMDGFWAGPTPEALSRMGRRVLAPVAVAGTVIRDELRVTNPVVMVGADVIGKKAESHGGGARPTTPESFGRIQAILDRGELIERDGRRRVYALEMEDGWWLLAVNATHQGEIVVRSLYAVDQDRLMRVRRRGERRAEGR